MRYKSPFLELQHIIQLCFSYKFDINSQVYLATLETSPSTVNAPQRHCVFIFWSALDFFVWFIMQKWSFCENQQLLIDFSSYFLDCIISIYLYTFNDYISSIINLVINFMEELVSNPYSNLGLYAGSESIMDKNCILKASLSYVMGGAMGLVMAMFMNAVEMREVEIGKIRRSTAIVLRKDWRRISGTGKGFASFGFFFVLF